MAWIWIVSVQKYLILPQSLSTQPTARANKQLLFISSGEGVRVIFSRRCTACAEYLASVDCAVGIPPPSSAARAPVAPQAAVRAPFITASAVVVALSFRLQVASCCNRASVHPIHRNAASVSEDIAKKGNYFSVLILLCHAKSIIPPLKRQLDTNTNARKCIITAHETLE